jgi:alpha-1,2-mannosyltransferase
LISVAAISDRKTSWLNPRRLRVHGVILAACLWSTYAWILSSAGLIGRNDVMKGADFVHFYTLGTLAREHRGGELYDMAAQSALTQERVPGAGRLLFVPLYGPQVSLLFAPLAALPYSAALSIWLLVNAILYLVCCYAIWRTCAHLQQDWKIVLLLALAYPAFFHVIAWGQTSVLALVCFTVAYLCLRARRMFTAGVALGCLIFKPQLGIAAGIVMLIALEWRVLAGGLSAALIQLTVGGAYFGSAAMRDYWQHILHVGRVLALLEPRPYQTHSLRAFWMMLVPWPGIAVALACISVAVVLYIAWRCWKSAAPLSLRYSGLLVATVLVSPHLTVYDLVILVPVFLLMADWVLACGLRGTEHVEWLLYACFVVPLASPLAMWTHVQLSVPVMMWLLWTIWRIGEAATPRQLTQALPA